MRGWLSKLWSKAYAAYQVSVSSKSPASHWTTKTILKLWDYTSSLWEHQNGILHGQTIAETERQELGDLHQQITSAYEEYGNDPFIIPRHLSSLFTYRTLHQRLKLDVDSLKCWLHSVWEAKLAQQQSQCRHSEAGRSFFHPRNKRPTQHQPDHDQSESISTSSTEELIGSDSSTISTTTVYSSQS